MEEKISEILRENYFEEIPKEIATLFTDYIDWLRKNCYAEDDYWVRVISDSEFEKLSTEETFDYWLCYFCQKPQ